MSALYNIVTVTLAMALTTAGCSSSESNSSSPDGGDIPDGSTANVFCSDPNDKKCPGTPAPGWLLEDKQPKSPKFGQKYGPDQLKGEILVVVLLAGWCGYCQAQVGPLARLQNDIRGLGYKVNIVAINKADAANNITELTSRSDIVIFQDTEFANGKTGDTAYELHLGRKDDIYVYKATGLLSEYLPGNSTVSTDLQKREGYQNVYDAILRARAKPGQ